MANIKESDIQSAICEYLAHKGEFFWRQNSGGMYREGRFFSTPKWGKNGVPDILIVKDGWFIGLEVKTPKGRQNEAQKLFEKEVKEAGGEYHVVRSIEDVQEIGL